MTDDQIITTARAAHVWIASIQPERATEEARLIAFARAIEARVRDECARRCRAEGTEWSVEWGPVFDRCVAVIRERAA